MRVRAVWSPLAATATVVVVLLGLLAPTGVTAHAASPRAFSASSTDPLQVNLTYLDLGGSWNCGRGDQLFQFFGNVQGGLEPYTYNWTFGDGSSPSTDPSPTHSYSRIGTFVVNVSVRDGAGTRLNASVSPIWVISDVCTGGTTDFGPFGVFGIALYVSLILAIILGVALVFRVRRRRPLPPVGPAPPLP